METGAVYRAGAPWPQVFGFKQHIYPLTAPALLCCCKGGSGSLSLWPNQPSQQVLTYSLPKEIKEFSSGLPWPQCKGNARSCRGCWSKGHLQMHKYGHFHLIHKNLGSFLYWISKDTWSTVLRPSLTLIKTQKYVPSIFTVFNCFDSCEHFWARL